MIRKKPLHQVCPHCSRLVKRAWVIRYESPGFVRLVFLCSHCEGVMKTEGEQRKPFSFPPSIPSQIVQ